MFNIELLNYFYRMDAANVASAAASKALAQVCATYLFGPGT